MFNLTEAAYLDEITVEVEREGKKLGFHVTLAGPGHEATLASEEAFARKDAEDEETRQQEAIEAIKAGKPAPKQLVSLAENRRRRVSLIAPRVLRSDPLVFEGTEYPSLTPGLAANVLANPKYGWLTDFLDRKLSTRANFFWNSNAI